MTIAAKIDAAIAANEAATVDSIDRYRLNGLSDQLRRYRCNLSRLMPDEQAIYAGPNMRGPAIEDLLRQSESIRGALTQRLEQALGETK